MEEQSAWVNQELLDAVEELHSTEGWKVSKKIERLEMSLYVFKANHDDLIQNIELFQCPDLTLDLWKADNREKLYQFLNEIARLLHNLVASAKTLVEHTRILSRELYEGTDFWTEYDSQITKRFTSYPLIQFVHKLRDYILHRGLPNITARMNFVQEPNELSTSLLINIVDLRKWDGWNVTSRRYLDTAGDKENLQDIIESYADAINSFHDWFYDRQIELHHESIKEAEALARKLGL